MADVVGAHLVGSAPVDRPEEIFELASRHLGGQLRRLGDGEVGERDTWIRWQYAELAASPQLAPTHVDHGYLGRAIEQFALVEGAGDVDLGGLGYADAALASYTTFAAMKAAGSIPDHLRFMVGLPTPLGVVTLYVAPGSRRAVLDAYQAAMAGQLRRILDAVPYDELAVQWEVCIEFGILERIWTLLDDDVTGIDARTAVGAHVVELGDLVPTDVELGYHLCYGDAGHEHFTQPADAGHLAWATTEILTGVGRPVQWIHLPVPRERTDNAFFEPLAAVDVPEGTELYLGLVHHTGGVEGTRARIEAATPHVPRFGLATECGLARRSLDTIPDILDQHRELARPVV